ncbi:hypothetical protein KCP74_13110 [Salmonella enterica subsp. enterica]|nr:hypothetical protein KCP74_13110 [Salmonella enterica subsp. enterica]
MQPVGALISTEGIRSSWVSNPPCATLSTMMLTSRGKISGGGFPVG